MTTWLRLLKLLRPHWRRVLLGVFLSLLALCANLGLLALSSWFITSMAIAGVLRAAIDYTLPAAAIRALALARAAGRYAERLVNHDTTLRILAGLRVWFFRRLEPLAPARLQARRSGDLLSRIRSDVDTLDDFYVRGVVPALVAACALAGAALFLSRYDGRLAWVDLGGLLLAGVALPLLLRPATEGPGREKVGRAADLRSSVVEGVQGMAELIVLGALDEHGRRMGAAGRALAESQRRLSSLQGIGDAGIAAAGSLAAWAGALILAPRVSGGSLGGSDFAMLTVFILASFEAIMPLPVALQRAGEMAAAAHRLFDLIDQPPAVPEPGSPAAAPRNGAAPLGLAVRGLRFRYSAEQPWIFDGLTFTVSAGSTTAVAGPTGAGKSTLVTLLMRFWDYREGSIVLDGQGPSIELRSLSGDGARALFSVMPQAPHLFHSSIRDNLLVARPREEETGDAELFAALEAAGLAGFVEALPEGLATSVGELGRELSAGEGRRLALARALLKDAPVYILDEPTEGLDEAAASALLRSVTTRLRGRTLILISHRDRDLQFADRVIPLEIDR
jgi:ATP-binding cassette, subfamily C, bacterial CydC